ncbi:hypothetical protein MJD09_23710, partial [bacterium]|nr:hypothetical protein [bacterium]
AGFKIFVMPAIGGPRRPVGPTWGNTSNPVWSPDGSQLAAVNKDSTGLPGAEIYRLSSYEKRKVALPGEQFERLYLSWSPDGNYLAYAAADNLYWLATISAIRIVRISDGSSYQIVNDGSLDFSPTWSLDSRRLYFASDRGGTTDLWQVKVKADGSPSGHAEQVSHGLGLHSLAFSLDHTKIAFSKEQRTQNLWRVAIPASVTSPAKWADVQQLTFETSMILRPDLSPDGKRVYFDSNRSGNQDLWSMPATGGELHQLTSAPAYDNSVRLSPDGSTLAFVSERSGRREIWTMPSSGGAARQITNHQYPKYWPRWSPDGQTIAFVASDTNSNLNFWIIPAQGGEARQVTSVGLVFSPLWWPDGKSLVSSDRRQLHRFPIAGGEPELLSTPGVRARQDGLRWSSDKTQIYFLGHKDRATNIWSRSLETGALRQLTDFSGRYGRLGRDFATDGTYLYFTWREHTGDIWVMDMEREE